jgi:hypothetical protein
MGNGCRYIDSTGANNKLGYSHLMEDLNAAIKEASEAVL